MTTKITSAEAYEYIKTTEFISYPSGVFDRVSIETLLREASTVHGFMPPSAKSFLDWARRYDVVEPVEGERGHYRWVASTEDQAVEIGRQISQEGPESVMVTDVDPDHPMTLPDSVVDDLDLAEDHYNYRESVEHESCLDDDEDTASRTTVADVRAYIVTRQKRLPRKEKKRMKKTFREVTGIDKVWFVREQVWELVAR